MNPRISLPLAIVATTVAGLNAQTFGPQLAAASPLSPSAENTPAANPVTDASWQLTAEQLDQLLGPIALYPDALIALILPSATASSDVVLAARYLAGGAAAPASIDDQQWDDSVKALAHYPTVVTWMDQNLAWTKQVGEAFVAQPAEVMKSIQRLRSAARAAGTLVDTPQQQIVTQAETIAIIPAQPDMIYVPYYDPDFVYVRRPNYPYYPGSFFSFSVGYPVGFWLGYNVDWGQRRIWMVDRRDRERYWRDQRDWRRPSFPTTTVVIRDDVRRTWTPNPAYVRPTQPITRRAGIVVSRPSAIALESTARPPASVWNSPDRGDRPRGDRGASLSQPAANEILRNQRGRGQNYTPGTTSSSSGVQLPSAAASAPVPPPVAPVAPPPQAQTYSRGYRAPTSNAAPSVPVQRSREREERSRPAPSPVSSSPSTVIASPAPAAATVVAPAATAPATQPAAVESSAAPKTSYSRGR